MNSGSNFSEEFIDELSQDKEFRDVYVADQVRARFALLIKALREQPNRGWSQAVLAERMGKTQSAISRIEDPDYGKLTVQTLLEVAAAFDLPLWIDIPEWSEWLRRMEQVEASCLYREGFDAAKLKLELCGNSIGSKTLDLKNFLVSQVVDRDNQNYLTQFVGDSGLARRRSDSKISPQAPYSNSVSVQSSGGTSLMRSIANLDVASLN